jgi:putative transcriptional regulator
MPDSLAPGLLIAVPQLPDPNFHRSVVFLMEHDESGALGVVVNRPSNLKIGELFIKLGLTYSGPPSARVLLGGPVQTEGGLVIHAEGNNAEDSRAITESIFVCSSHDALSRLFERPAARALFLLGHAGWGEGQLEREVEAGVWIPAAVDDALVFDIERHAVWDLALRGLGIDPATIVSGADPEAGSN